MNCQQTADLLHAYLDQELDLVRSLETEQHLQACRACDQRYQEQLALRQALTRSALCYPAPQRLHARLRIELRSGSHAEAPAPRRSSDWRRLWRQWLAPATALAGLVLLLGAFWLARPSSEARLDQALVSAHLRSLMPEHLTDVASSDQHTVKPWFSGKLAFSPPVIDPAGQGFPLLGGRLDVVEEQPVAALVYQRRKHFINLFIWPSTHGGTTREKFLTQRGYNLLHWTQADMEWWAVSDVGRSDLQEFVTQVRGHAP